MLLFADDPRKPCEIQRIGNAVTVLFEGTKEAVTLNLSREEDVRQYAAYFERMFKR